MIDDYTFFKEQKHHLQMIKEHTVFRMIYLKTSSAAAFWNNHKKYQFC